MFADTGWESDLTYQHLDHLREKLGPIDVVGRPGGMRDAVKEGTNFPSRLQRWCTRKLKLEPLRAFYDEVEATGAVSVAVIGVRAEESAARRGLKEFEDDESWGGHVWRPILQWPVGDVLAIHHRHGVSVNPLYRLGHSRVGCYPCVMANKEDIRLVAEHAPERIAEIRQMEQDSHAERLRRNEERPGRYTLEQATFFTKQIKAGTAFVSIDEVVQWAHTKRGGREMLLFPAVPDGGCFRWGVCDAPPAQESTADAVAESGAVAAPDKGATE